MQLPPQISNALARSRLDAVQSSLGIRQLAGSLVGSSSLLTQLELQLIDRVSLGNDVTCSICQVPLLPLDLPLLLSKVSLQRALLFLADLELVLQSVAVSSCLLELPLQLGNLALSSRLGALQSGFGILEVTGSLFRSCCLVPQLALEVLDVGAHGVEVAGSVGQGSLQLTLLLLDLCQLSVKGTALLVGLFELLLEVRHVCLCGGLGVVQSSLGIVEGT